MNSPIVRAYRLSITQSSKKESRMGVCRYFADDGITDTSTENREEFNRMIEGAWKAK